MGLSYIEFSGLTGEVVSQGATQSHGRSWEANFNAEVSCFTAASTSAVNIKHLKLWNEEEEMRRAGNCYEEALIF